MTRTSDNSRSLSDPERSVLAQAADILNVDVFQLLDPNTGSLQPSWNAEASQPLHRTGYPQTPAPPYEPTGNWHLPFQDGSLDPFTFDMTNPGLHADPSNTGVGDVADPFNTNNELVSTWAKQDGGHSRSITDSGPMQRNNAQHDVDTQQWESVQIRSVRRMSIPTDPTVADYVWLSNDTELNDLHVEINDPPEKEQDGELAVTDAVMRRPQNRRGPFKTPALREQTSNTRKLKACVRCRTQRIRCIPDESDPTGECMTCKELQDPRLHKLPCARYKITECTLYRTGKAPGLEFTTRWPTMKLKDITKWANSDVREIEVLSDVCPVPLKFKVRRFVVMPGDSLKRGWMDGKVKRFALTTPYAIVNMAQAVKDMRDYIDAHVLDCIAAYTKGADDLVRHTYEFAIKYMVRHGDSEEGLFLMNFFRLWFAVRRTHTLEHISGEDTLDMQPGLHNKAFPWSGKVPLPPVMIQQLDMILTLGILQPLRKKYLADLQRHIGYRSSTSWMLVYLTIFMGSHGCAVTTAENYNSARRHGLKRRYAMPNFIAERHHAANVYLSHYHYYTQLFKADPFQMDWKRRQTTAFADLTPPDIHFLLATKRLVDERQERFKANHDQNLYEDEFFWISQMYEKDWQPRDTEIDYEDGTVNNVPLQEYE